TRMAAPKASMDVSSEADRLNVTGSVHQASGTITPIDVRFAAMTDTGKALQEAEVSGGGPLVVLENVNKYFGDLHVLKDIDLTIHRREVGVVSGPWGRGKPTLCRAINRLDPIDGGITRIDGRPLPAEGKALAELRADVGMVFQSFNLFAHKTILQNVTLG